MTKRTNCVCVCVCYLYERKPRTEIMIAKVGVELADELVWSGKGNEKFVEIYYYQENTAGSCLVKWSTEVSGDVVELFIIIFISYTRVVFGERIRPGAFGRPGGKTPSERFSLFSSAGIPTKASFSYDNICTPPVGLCADIFFSLLRRFAAIPTGTFDDEPFLSAWRSGRRSVVFGFRRHWDTCRAPGFQSRWTADSDADRGPVASCSDVPFSRFPRCFPANKTTVRFGPQTRPLTVTFGQLVDE